MWAQAKNRQSKCIYAGGILTKTAYVNSIFTLAAHEENASVNEIYIGCLLKTTANAIAIAVFTLAFAISHLLVSLFYSSGWLNEPLVKKVINVASSSPDQNSLVEPPSIGGECGAPKIAKYKGEVLFFISLKEVAHKG